MKKFLFLFFFVIHFLGGFAVTRTLSEKIAIAQSMLQSFANNSTRTTQLGVKTFKENAAITVLGYEQGGYVVIANDNSYRAVIAYSELPFREDNPGLNWWLKSVSQMMSCEQAAAVKEEATSTAARTAIPQLMVSEWGQDAPFNNLCPTGKYGKCPTGCVATAMAQVLYYHKCPQKAIGKGSCTYGGKTYAQNLSGIEYAWDKMQPKYDTPSGEGCDDVATLLYDCGLSIGMNYDDQGSGAYNFEASTAFKNHFSLYSTYYDRSYYTSAEWMNLVYEQLSNNNPVVYGGVSDVDGQQSGHSFVIDGYQEDGLVHVNWGWNGQGNGYYDIALLNPIVGDSMSFSNQQDMVVCQTSPFEVFSRIGMRGITIKKVDETSISIAVSQIVNLLPDDFKGELAIVAEKDGKKKVISSVSERLVYGISYSSFFTEASYSIEDLEDGEYRIYVAAKSDGDPDWQIFRALRGGKNCYILTKSNGTINLKADSQAWTTEIGHVFPSQVKKQASKIYNINGQQVDASYHGIVIKNGKKVVQ